MKKIILIIFSLLPALIATISLFYFDLSWRLETILIILTLFSLSLVLFLSCFLPISSTNNKKQKNKILSYCITIVFGVISFLMLYLCLYAPYTLRPDRFNIIKYSLFIIFTPAFIIEAIIISRKNKKNKKYFPQFSLIGILFFIILGLVKTTAIFFLNYGNTPLKTTNAFVLDYDRGVRRSPDEYTLRFANNQRISNKKFEINAIIEAQAQDCLSVQYRENAVVIEVLPLANLGKMNEKECLTQ